MKNFIILACCFVLFGCQTTKIVSSPPAKIYHNGKYLGKTPKKIYFSGLNWKEVIVLKHRNKTKKIVINVQPGGMFEQLIPERVFVDFSKGD